MNQSNILLLFRNRAFRLTAITLWVLTSSCEEFPEPLFSNSVIQGSVDIYSGSDEDLEKISISAKGPYEHDKNTLTNSTGSFLISELGNGTYELEISKEGYGTRYHYGIQLFGNDTVRIRDELYERMTGRKLPKFYEVHTSEYYDFLNDKTIVITTNKSQGDIPARVFLSEDQEVSYKNFQCTRPAHAGRRSGFDSVFLYVENLPFESGKKVYLIVYICNPEEHYGYYNSNTGVLTFSTLEKDEHSQIMSFTMR